MAIQLVNLGTYANSGTGDDLRTAFEKVNANFQFLDETSAVTADNIGSGSKVFKEKIGDNLQLRTLVAGTGMTVTENSNDITLTSIIDITRDTSPELGGNLTLGGFDVVGTGNVNITGSAAFSGNVAVNGGDITTTAATFNLVNTAATTVNFAGNANILNIGKNTGLTTVAGELQVNDDVVITNNGRLKTTNSSAYLFNETANYVFLAQDAIRVDIGSNSGEVVFGNDVNVPGNSTLNNVNVLGTLEVNLVNDLIIPGGLFGYLLSTDGDGNLSWVRPVIGESIGAGVQVFKQKVDDKFVFRTLVSNDAGITISQDDNEIFIGSVIDISRDNSPQLGGNLNLNNFTVTGNGNININGEAVATGGFRGNTFGFHDGDVNGNIFDGGVKVVNRQTRESKLDIVTDSDNLILAHNTANLFNSSGILLINGAAAQFFGTLIGNVSGNLTGNVTGNTTGSHKGNVVDSADNVKFNAATGVFTGNVTGNLTGDVTGNTTGSHKGNVVDNFDNVRFNATNGTFTGNVVGNTTGTHKGNILDDNNITRFNSITATFSGNLTGNVTGSVNGNVTGNTTGVHKGNVVDNSDVTRFNATTGTFTGDITGNVNGNVLGNTTGVHKGNIVDNSDITRFNATTGTFIGELTGNISGNAATVTNGVYTTSSINALADVDTATIPPTSGQVLKWNGAAWTPASDTGSTVTYTVSAEVVSGGANLRLLGSDATTDDIKFASGSNVTITRTDANTITISSTASGGGSLDFGTFVSPAGFTLDLGTFV